MPTDTKEPMRKRNEEVHPVLLQGGPLEERPESVFSAGDFIVSFKYLILKNPPSRNCHYPLAEEDIEPWRGLKNSPQPPRGRASIGRWPQGGSLP